MWALVGEVEKETEFQALATAVAKALRRESKKEGQCARATRSTSVLTKTGIFRTFP